MIDIQGDVKSLTKELDRIQRRVIPAAVPAALNKTMDRINTRIVKGVSKDLGIAQKYIRKRAKKYPANRRKWESKNWIGTKVKIPVSSIYKSKRGQLKYIKGKTRVPLNRLFHAKMPSGHEGIFYRKGKSRLPIQEVMIDLNDSFVVKNIEMIAGNLAGYEFPKLLSHELRFRLDKQKI